MEAAVRMSMAVFACGDWDVKSGGVMSVEAVVFACGGGGVAVGFFPPQRNNVLFLETSPGVATCYLLQPCLHSEDRDIRFRRTARSHGRTPTILVFRFLCFVFVLYA